MRRQAATASVSLPSARIILTPSSASRPDGVALTVPGASLADSVAPSSARAPSLAAANSISDFHSACQTPVRNSTAGSQRCDRFHRGTSSERAG